MTPTGSMVPEIRGVNSLVYLFIRARPLMRVTPRGYYQKICNRQLHNGSKENYNTTSDSIDQREKSMISKH